MGSPRVGSTWRPAVALCVMVAVCLCARVGRASGFAEQDLNDCFAAEKAGVTNGSGSFSCSICGVPVSCTENPQTISCTWGSLSGADNGLGPAFAAGVQLYCLNQGGSMVTSASAAGVQGATLDRAFKGSQQGSPISYGGIAEYSNYTGGLASYGLALPVSYARKFTLDNTDLDLSGQALFGHNESITQYGFTASPTLRYFPQTAAADKMVYGLSLPVAGIVTTGSGLNTSFVYHVGLGGIAGWSSASGFGVGAAADVLYAAGVQIPLQIVGRYAFDVSGATVAIQPGISTNVMAAGKILDAMQQNVLVGWDTGQWVFGARVFRQGSDGWVLAAGASTSTRTSKLAAGTSEAYQRNKPEEGQPKPAGPVAPRAQTGARVVVLAEVAGDVTASANLRTAIRDALAAHQVKALSPAEAAPAIAGATPTDALDVSRLDGIRRAARATLAITVVATPNSTGSMSVKLAVTGGGITAQRELVSEPEQVASDVRQALEALLSKVDLRALPEVAPVIVAPPAPPPTAPPVVAPPPTAPPPTAPPPTAPPPTAPPVVAPPPTAPPPAPPPTAPPPLPPTAAPLPPPPPNPVSPGPGDSACTKDTDCKGDRICEDGRCVKP